MRPMGFEIHTMKTSTVLRLCAAAIIFLLLAFLGEMQEPSAGLVLGIVAFAAAFEIYIVRPLQEREKD